MLLALFLLADFASLIANGDAAFAQRDFRAALFAYQDATRADPASVAAVVKLGETYARMGHDVEAIAQFTQALRLDPHDAATEKELAASRERLAIVSPKRAEELTARERYGTAVKLIHEKRFADALPLLDEALRLRPGYGVALVARGSAHMGLSQHEAAAADYEAARVADPSMASPLFGLAEAFRALGDAHKAAQFYREYASSPASDVQPQLKEYALRNAQALALQ